MPAALPPDRNQPSFYRFPVNNNRTGYQPVYLPMILVIPRRKINGTVLLNSGVFDVRFYIVDAPEQCKVAGPFNQGILVPQVDRFTVPVSSLQLLDVQIDPEGRNFYNPAGEQKAFEEAEEGDTFEYTTLRGNITSTIPYYPDADYHDMSLFVIDVDDLPRPERYFFVWEAKYYTREVFNNTLASVVGPTCVNTSEIGIAQIKSLVLHPGEVHESMFDRTPSLYFDQENTTLANDQVLKFYRPFADILQDAFEEQTFLDGINHINKIPAQLIPYLAFLIGWDLPNFPGVTDNVRRSILREAVRLQKLKGSRRVLIELFDIFGFTIDLINLWYSTDGNRLIAPGEALPDNIPEEEIETETVCQNEPLVSDYNEVGFGQFEIPLVYTPNGEITITAFLVKDGPTRDALLDLTEQINSDPDALEEMCVLPNGTLSPKALFDALPTDDDTVISNSEIVIDHRSGRTLSAASTDDIPVINQNGVKFDNLKNIVDITFDHHFDFSGDEKIFIFATYPRQKIILPDILKNLRSNRFDVRILLKNGQEIDSSLLEFLMQFVFKLKAFHSLLRKLIFDLISSEVYNVMDFCASDDRVQVPPPVDGVPEEPCTPEAATGGLKQADLDLRDEIFNGLLREFDNWKSLDGTHQVSAAARALVNLPINEPDGNNCQYTPYGQERILAEPDKDFDHNEDTRPQFCSTSTAGESNCFKGRVQQLLDVDDNLILPEKVICKPCVLSVGSGSYWTFPANTLTNLRNGFGSFIGQNSRSFLGKKIFNYNHPIPESLHYNNRPGFEDFLCSDRALAYQRPSLCIEKDNLNFPSHRLPTMSNLEEDFTHPIHRARPWDGTGDDLNAKLVGPCDNQSISYDDAPLIYLGNGLEPDISSLGSHDSRDHLVTHKVWMVTSEGHPALELDPSVVITSEEAITFDSSLPFGSIQRSANQQCDQDYRSGYPAEYGSYSVDITEYDFTRPDQTEQLAEGLGIPVGDRTSISDGVELLYTFGSQILVLEDEVQYRHHIPYRLDCDCLEYECENGTTGATGATSQSQVEDLISLLNLETCPTNSFFLKDGSFDKNCDQVEFVPKVVLEEIFGTCSTCLDGTIPNMLCVFNSDGNVPSDASILSEGVIYYRDSYGVIYETAWTFGLDVSGDYRVLDIISVTKSPHVWGEEPQGYLQGLAIFRKGIITTTRKVIHVFDDNSYVIQAEGFDQKIDFFQSNATCGQQQFMDNFCFHVYCGVKDAIESVVTCGTRWAEIDDVQVEWPALTVDTAGNVDGYMSSPCQIQPFIFMDVWGNDEAPLPTVCCRLNDDNTDGLELTLLPDTVVSSGKVAPNKVSDAVNGVFYERYSGFFFSLPDFDSLTPDATGMTDNFNFVGAPSDFFAFRYTCYINISTAGTYTFYTESDDGSQLFINDTLVVDNDGVHSLTEVSGSIYLESGFHEMTVTYFELVGPNELNVSYAGPGVTKTIIPDVLLYKSPVEYLSDGTTDCSEVVTAAEDVQVILCNETVDPTPEFQVQVTNNGEIAVKVGAKFTVTGGRCLVSGDFVAPEEYTLDAGCTDTFDFSFLFQGTFPCCDIEGTISLDIECCSGTDFLKPCSSLPDEIYDVYITASDLTASPEGTDYTTRLENLSVSPASGRSCADGTNPERVNKIIKYNFINQTSSCVQVLMRHVKPGTDTPGAGGAGEVCEVLRDSPSDGGTVAGCEDKTLAPSGFGGATNFICLCPNNKVVPAIVQYHVDSIAECCDDPEATWDLQVEARSVTLLDGTLCGDSGILSPCVTPC